MTAFRFSRRAESDLMEIARYTLDTWGEKQTIHYIDNLEAVARDWPEVPNSVAHATISVPVYVTWNAGAM